MTGGILLVAFLVVAAAERVYERRFSHQAVRGERKMAWSYTVLHPIHVSLFFLTALEFFWVKREIHIWVTGVGLALWVASVAVRLTAIRTLAKFWSLHLEIREGHELVTHGIYRFVRHPAYAAILAEVASLPLVGNAYYTLALALGVYWPILLCRWWLEEKEMVEKFGERYVDYMRRVPAFLPWRCGR
jgi:protein-S-isoprenylcysteine O-methyltransferase Ste14